MWAEQALSLALGYSESLGEDSGLEKASNVIAARKLNENYPRVMMTMPTWTVIVHVNANMKNFLIHYCT
jgi:hypothetical protein